MLDIEIFCNGNLKEQYLRDGCAEYLKRISTFARIAVKEFATDQKMLAALPQRAYKIALCIEGKQLSSKAVAARLKELFTQGRSDVTFIIGGSLGLHPSVTARADLKLSMSPMTFPHQLARVMLLEQLFRAAKINAGERYHK